MDRWICIFRRENVANTNVRCTTIPLMRGWDRKHPSIGTNQGNRNCRSRPSNLLQLGSLSNVPGQILTKFERPVSKFATENRFRIGERWTVFFVSLIHVNYSYNLCNTKSYVTIVMDSLQDTLGLRKIFTTKWTNHSFHCATSSQILPRLSQWIPQRNHPNVERPTNIIIWLLQFYLRWNISFGSSVTRWRCSDARAPPWSPTGSLDTVPENDRPQALLTYSRGHWYNSFSFESPTTRK